MIPEIVSTFHKSSYSDQHGDCLEAAGTRDHGHVVRDSKRAHGPVLTFSRTPWHTFLDSLTANARQ